MSCDSDKVVKVYRDVAKVPSVTKATLLSDKKSRYRLQSTWKQRDLERSESVKFQHSTIFHVGASDVEVIGVFPGEELNKELLSCFSHCGNKKAVIREVTSKDSKSVQYLEIWDNGSKTTNINLKEADKHGAVVSNDQFAAFQWSHDDRRLLYVADKKDMKSCSFFNLKKKDDETPGNEHIWKDSWGEQLPDVYCPTLCVFEIETGKVSTYDDHIPNEYSIGQAVWLGDNESVVFVAWRHDPYRLGLVYCPIRDCKLLMLNIQSLECKQISNDNVSVRSPRVHPDGKRVFYLENPIGGPHFPCARMMEAVISEPNQTVERRIIVDRIKLPKSDDSFSGIYAVLMPRRCFSRDGSYLFMSTFFRSYVSIISVNISNGEVEMITKTGCYDMLDICDDIIVANHSTPTTPPEIVIGKVKQGLVDNWHVIVQPSRKIEDMSWSVRSFIPDLPNADYPDVTAEYILFKPLDHSDNKTLIVFPHGGPHTSSTTSFMHSIVALTQLGYTVVQINYRGSVGFGQDGIDSLPGRVGKQDVQDVHQIAKLLKATEDFDNVFITGGSHGGFLSLHLISQFPDFYLAAAVRNPVASMSLMCPTSDIPDWNYCESLQQKFDYCALPVAKYYDVMLEKSPIALIQNAKAPLLMQLGQCDLRVPPSQGIHWAKLYKALGRTCKVLMYKDNNHPIAKVDAEADAFVNMVMWFVKYKNPQ